jgi:exodeoxyribonuclease VII small subunit
MAEPFAGPTDGDTPAPPAVAGMSFEEALAELEGIVQKLERGQLDLESSIQAYERGTALREHCAEKLRLVQLRVEKLTLDREGNPRLQPFEEG